MNNIKPIICKEELQNRLEKYMKSDLFQRDINELTQDYQAQGLPVPPMEQLRAEAVAQARECLETIMICEVEGHLWVETADPENGTSTLTCRRCGEEEHLRWL